MDGVRPFQFMVGTREIVDREALVRDARLAESVGYSHLCIHDHLLAQMAPIPLLTAVAMATERLRLCPLVFNNDLRHPAVLAQDLATLDVLSEGRVVVGIGAGWNEPEYASIGLPFDPAGRSGRGDRIARDDPAGVRGRAPVPAAPPAGGADPPRSAAVAGE